MTSLYATMIYRGYVWVDGGWLIPPRQGQQLCKVVDPVTGAICTLSRVKHSRHADLSVPGIRVEWSAAMGEGASR